MTALVRVPLRIVRTGASLGLEVARLVERRVRGRGQQQRPAPPASTPMPPSIGDSAPAPPPPPAPPRTPAADAAPQPEFEQRHVDTAAEQVASFGPEADAGATITVSAPWPGYDAMGARDVVERVRASDATTKAAVLLYESRGRARKTVLAAARR